MLVHTNTSTPNPSHIENCFTDFHFTAPW